MNLEKKKMLASKALGVGKSRVVFINSRLDEIKEAITKQDIKGLYEEGAIQIREIRGRKKVSRRRNRSVGNVRKKVPERKQKYVIITRKLRKHLVGWVGKNKVPREQLDKIRKKIKNREFKSKSSFSEFLKINETRKLK